jgi:hypothetical protein
MVFSKLDYCQFLLSSQVNFTMTHLADHLQKFSHDTINRYLSQTEMRPRHLWEKVQTLLGQHPEAFLLFDDTLIDKSYGTQIDLVRRQWSGNEKRVVPGIGLVSCVYVHPHTGEFWVIDYRIYAPDRDGKTKLDHVADMFQSALSRDLLFDTVLMDSWYATKDLILLFEGEQKRFYCPIKADRLVDDSGGTESYRRTETLEWSVTELKQGKRIKVKGFPGSHKVQLFRVVVSSHRTEYVITNDMAQNSAQGAREVCAVRWKIEELHRDLKQFTGIANCQCRKGKIQRNHIHCALLVWTRLRQLANDAQCSIQQIKRGLLSEYLIQQLKNPTVSMIAA